jgi:hypothetical protein
VLKLLGAKALEFLAARHTELIQKVDGPAFCHIPKLDKALVRFQIGIQDSFGDFVGASTTTSEDNTRILPSFAYRPTKAGMSALSF